MRVTKTSEGQFTVEDEPMCLDGEVAATFLADMRKNDSHVDDAKKRFLAECAAAFERMKQASS